MFSIRKAFWRIFPGWLLLICLLGGQTQAAADIRIVSHNLNRFFDDRDDGDKEQVLSTRKYHQRLEKLITRIATDYEFADIMAFQEVENINVLRDIAERLALRYDHEYQAYLIEGNDQSGIDVGFLVSSNFKVNTLTALFSNSKLYGKASLYSRPPLLLEACADECLTLVNLHLRSMRGLSSSRKRTKVAKKRHRQAQTLARWIHRRQNAKPNENLLLLGDFNALTPSDKHVDVVGTIRGNPDAQRPQWKSRDLIGRDLINITNRLKPDERVSYIYRKQPQQLDYMLVSQPLLAAVKSVHFNRIDYSLSDHAALIADLRFDQSAR